VLERSLELNRAERVERDQRRDRDEPRVTEDDELRRDVAAREQEPGREAERRRVRVPHAGDAERGCDAGGRAEPEQRLHDLRRVVAGLMAGQ
jgi:hypothetical protein